MSTSACHELAAKLGVPAELVVELWTERAAIREYEGGQLRVEAEVAALDEVRAQFASPLAVLGERKGPRGVTRPVGDALADTHKKV